MRKLLVVVAGLLTIVLVAGVAVVIGVHVTHPRDESAYVAYVKTYGDTGSDQPIAHLPSTGVLIAAGERACDWLGDQPVALWRTGRKYRFGPVMDRYLATEVDRPLAWGAVPPERSAVAAGAWSRLCPATWELHRPHRLHGNSGGD